MGGYRVIQTTKGKRKTENEGCKSWAEETDGHSSSEGLISLSRKKTEQFKNRRFLPLKS
jgi:hypothetical protein